MWGQIDAYPICFPLRADRLSAVVTRYTVPASAARPFVPGRFFDLVECDGAAQLVITGLEFEGGDAGPGCQVYVAFRVRPVWDPAAPPGTYPWRSLVGRQFDREAGHRVFGVDPVLADVSVSCGAGAPDGAIGFEVAHDGGSGEPALWVRLPPGTQGPAGPPVTTPLYTCINGLPHCTPFEMTAMRGVVADTSAVEVGLGSGAIADALRRLGLPRAPDVCLWDESLTMTCDATVPVDPAPSRSRRAVPSGRSQPRG
jgi:hypothetical protein